MKSGALRWRVNQDAVAAWLHGRPGILAEIARAEVRDLMASTPEIQALERQLARLVRTAAPSLVELYGCGDLTTARIIGEVADIARF